LQPSALDAEEPGFKMTYADYLIGAQDVKVGDKNLTAQYTCAFFDEFTEANNTHSGITHIDPTFGLWNKFNNNTAFTCKAVGDAADKFSGKFWYGWGFLTRELNEAGTDWEYNWPVEGKNSAGNDAIVEDIYWGSDYLTFEYDEDIDFVGKETPAGDSEGTLDNVYFYISDKKFDQSRDAEIAYFDLQYPNDDMKVVNWAYDYNEEKNIADAVKGQTLEDLMEYDPGQFDRCSTLSELKDYVWIDLSSLSVKVTSASSTYKFEDYYTAPFWTNGTNEIKYDKENWFASYDTNIANLKGITMKLKDRTTLLPALNSAVLGEFQFDVYDMWFHKRTVKIPFKIWKPRNATNARRK
jgi:hypothetical protein